nr:hypothetical protein [Tanacetum cinerariifolium]
EGENGCDVLACFTTFSNILFDAEYEFDPVDDQSLSDKDSNSCMEEIDLSFNLDDPMPPSIEDDDDDSKRDILILEELPSNYSLSLLENESFHFDIPSFSRPPAKPPDEIDLTLTPDDSMPQGIEDDDYDFEGDILILEELLSNDSLSLLENESFHFDIPSSPRPPAKPPNDDEIEPNSGILTVKVVKLSDPKKRFVGGTPCLS